MSAAPIRRVFCHANPADAECVEARRQLEERLRRAGFETAKELATSGDESADLMVILGGDGFLMESLHGFSYPSIPVFGVNFGTVGFHMNPKSCLESMVSVLEERKFQAEACPVLEATAVTESGEKTISSAFNDFFIERQTRQSLRIRVSINGTFFNRLAGDGLLISTAVGSTAYNLAAGGPAVHPGVGGLVISPLYPHRASPFHSLQFSLMLPLESRIDVEAEDLPKRPMRLVADGRSIEGVASVQVRDSGKRISLLRSLDNDFLQTLVRKFMGGGAPG